MLMLVLLDFVAGVFIDPVLVIVSFAYVLFVRTGFLNWLMGIVVVTALLGVIYALGLWTVGSAVSDTAYDLDDVVLWVPVALAVAIWICLGMILKAIFVAGQRRVGGP